MAELAETVARAFHESYERQAACFGYETRPESAVPWEQVPASNKVLMVAVATDLLERGVIAEGVPDSGEGWERELFPADSSLPQRFHDEGMMWLANRVLHPFGWALGAMAKGGTEQVVGLMLVRTADTDGIVVPAADEVKARRSFFAAMRRGATVVKVPEPMEQAEPRCAACGTRLWETAETSGCPNPRCEAYAPVEREETR